MRVCVSITEPTVKKALASCQLAREKGADLVEVRFDYMKVLPSDLTVFRRVEIPMVATLRSAEQGGQGDWPAEERERFLRRAARAGFEYIDLEPSSTLLERTRSFGETKVIVSSHDFAGTPTATAIVDILISNASRGNVAKAAFTVRTVEDLFNIVQASRLFSLTSEKYVLIGMGELGQVTRLIASRLGCDFTYASMEPGKEAAPGQVDLATLKALGDDPIITGLVGQPLGHSISPQLHQAAFAALGLHGRYLKFPAAKEELADLLSVVRDLGLRGLNVTIPHKEAVISLLDEIDAISERAQAVNTIINQHGRLIGRNTDVSGLAKAFEAAEAPVRGKKALVIGAGGAARACCTFLSMGGAIISIANRTPARAEQLAKEFSATALRSSELSDHAFDIIVNCTPLGMVGFPDEIPVDPSVFHPGQVVMDTVYNPPVTPFLAAASAAGAKIIPGIEMLIYQAMDAFEAWTGQRPPYEVMAQAARVTE